MFIILSISLPNQKKLGNIVWKLKWKNIFYTIRVDRIIKSRMNERMKENKSSANWQFNRFNAC